MAHRLNTVGTNQSGMDDESMVWVELLSSTPVRKLMSYAQQNFAQQSWMNAQELADASDVSPNTIYDYVDDVCLLDVYERRSEGRSTVYRPNAESYVLSYLDDAEAIIRHNIASEEEL